MILSDLLDAFGVGVAEAYLGRPLGYEDVFGLWLNLPRVLLRRAFPTAQGVSLAFRRGSVELPYFEAVTNSPEEAEELQFRSNVERAKAALYAKHGIDPNG